MGLKTSTNGGPVRRVGSILASAALAIVLFGAVARASSFALAAPGPDLGSELMLRLFGETSDSSASFAAAQGDRTSESPLRDLALQTAPAAAQSAFVSGVTVTPLAGRDATPGLVSVSDSVLSSAFDAGIARGVRFAPPAQSPDDTVTLIPSSALLTAAYQPIAAPVISPAPGTAAFDSVPAATQSAAFAPSDVNVGGVQFQGHVQGSSSETPALSLHDTSGNAGADFQVRAGKRDIGLNLTTQYEHLFRNDSNSFSSALGSTSSWQLPNADAPLVIPNYADLNQLSVGAGVAVPVLRGLTLNLNYGVQHLYGGYGLPGLVNLDAINNTYGGKLTFDIPDASKTLSISAYQDRFTDSLLPLNGSTQTREDVNFTVKF
jgi:hypothetical protein